MQALHKHLGTEVRNLKSAIQQRDAKIQHLEYQLQTEHEEASKSIEAFNQEISTLKGLSFWSGQFGSSTVSGLSL